MNRHKLFILTAAACILCLSSGCAVTVAEATHCMYDHMRGDLMGIVPYPLETVIPVSEKVIAGRSGYDLSEQSSSFLDASFIAYDQQARKVQLDLSRTEDNQTKIQIRIGIVGDRLESSMLYGRIVNQLSQTATGPPTVSPAELRYSAGL